MLSQESHYYTSSVTWLIPGPWDYSLVQQHGSTSQAAQKDQLKIKAALSLALPGSNKQCMEKVHFFPLSLCYPESQPFNKETLKNTQWNNNFEKKNFAKVAAKMLEYESNWGTSKMKASVKVKAMQ